MYVNIYIYMYIYMYVCVWRERDRESGVRERTTFVGHRGGGVSPASCPKRAPPAGN